MIRRLIGTLVVVLVAALVAADFATKHFAADALATRARQSTGASSSSASISGFPFLYDTLVQGRVHGVSVRMSDVPAGPVLILQSVTVDLVSVRLDRHRLLSNRKVRITAIAQGTAIVDVSAPELGVVAHHSITVGAGDQLLVDVAGRTLAATASMTGGHVLVISAGGIPVFSVDLARSPMVPACSMSVQSTATGIEATCTMRPVPTSVIAALSART